MNIVCQHAACLDLKALGNEDTLLLIMFLGLRKLGNIWCGRKMFLNKLRNIFLRPGHKFCVRNKCCARGQTGNIFVANNVSATMCPRFQGPLVLGT